MALFGRPTERDAARAEAYRSWFHQRHPYALASFVLGVFSLIEFGLLIIFGVAGIALGIRALKELGESDPRFTPDRPCKGQALAWAGIFFSALSLVIAAAFYLGWFDSLRIGASAG